jgi:hypothetical protein
MGVNSGVHESAVGLQYADLALDWPVACAVSLFHAYPACTLAFRPRCETDW